VLGGVPVKVSVFAVVLVCSGQPSQRSISDMCAGEHIYALEEALAYTILISCTMLIHWNTQHVAMLQMES